MAQAIDDEAEEARGAEAQANVSGLRLTTSHASLDDFEALGSADWVPTAC
jgi:hypothetical protein